MYKKAYECCTSKEVEQCKECPLCDFGNTQLDCKTELLRKLKVYELKIDVAIDDNCSCRTELYATEERAKKAFNFEIVQAMQDYGIFDEQTGELIDDDWILDKSNNSWELYVDGWYVANHCAITITEIEILD